jgi:hypothetical protein
MGEVCFVSFDACKAAAASTPTSWCRASPKAVEVDHFNTRVHFDLLVAPEPVG